MQVTIQTSEELKNIMSLAKSVSSKHGRKNNSLYFLFAVYNSPLNSLLPVLKELGILLQKDNDSRPEDKHRKYVLDAVKELKKIERTEHLEERDDILRTVHNDACLSAFQVGLPTVNSMFYMKCLLDHKDSLVVRVFNIMKLDTSKLRSSLLRKITLLPRDTKLLDIRGQALSEGGDDMRWRIADGATPPKPVPQVLTPLPRTLPVPPVPNAAPGSASSGAPTVADPPAAREPNSRGQAPMLGNLRSPVVQASQAHAAGAGGAEAHEEPKSDEKWSIDPAEYPLLTRITRNLTAEAAQGRIDPVIGRRKEIEQMIHILRKRRANNPVLVGEPGVGKTALVEGLALEIAEGTPRAAWLSDRVLLSLETSSIVAGTQLRGSLSEKMNQLKSEVKKAEGRIIVFIDEIHTIVGAGAGDSALDAANELKAVLARGEFPCIGATTLQEYKKHIERDPALERRFQPVFVEEPSPAEAEEICSGIIGFYEKHHSVKYDHRAIEAAVRLTSRYMMERHLPDKAIDVLDTAGAAAAVEGDELVTEDRVGRIVASKVGIPVDRILFRVESRFAEMEHFLRQRVVGHERAIGRICEAVKRGFAGFSANRPLASFLMVGAPGVGKSQTACALAEFLFGSTDAVLTFHMNEFTENHSVGKLIGTAPGYVGHEQGGRLTEAMYRRPFQLIVFRDILAAHQDVQELVAQVVRNGVLTDGRGRRVFFTNAVIVVTQDVDVDRLGRLGDRGKVGFVAAPSSDSSALDEALLKEVRRDFLDSLYSSPDERLVFRPLSQEDITRVIGMEVGRIASRLLEERNISFEIDGLGLTYLRDAGAFTDKAGGRELRVTLARHLEAWLADRILDGQIQAGERVTITSDGSGLCRVQSQAVEQAAIVPEFIQIPEID